MLDSKTLELEFENEDFEINSQDMNNRSCLYIKADFIDSVLTQQIQESYEIDDIFKEETIGEFIRKSYNPEEIYEEDVLSEWAKNNGYNKEKSNV